MEIDVNKEELEFIMRFCKRSIQFATQLGDKAPGIFGPDREGNIEKATKLYTKLEKVYKTCIK